ncbi:20 kDa chaperonin, chloroplastic [Linum grandiflorum]
MAAIQLTPSSTSISPRSLSSFNPSSTVKFASFPTLNPARSIRRLAVVQANSSTVATEYNVVKPLGSRVMVKIKKEEEITSGGVFFPESVLTDSLRGEVVAFGRGKYIGGRFVETGTQVVYSKNKGTKVEYDGTSHMIMRKGSIVGVLETDDIKDLKPVDDRVFIKVAEAEDKTAGGLVLAMSFEEKPSIGTVVAVGPGTLYEDGVREPVPVNPGDTVLYSKYEGDDFKGNDGTNYIALGIEDVMAVLS